MERLPRLLLCILAITVTGSCRSLSTETAPQNPAVEQAEQRDDISAHGAELLKQGREVFRYDTFGSEEFWGGQLRLQEPIAGRNTVAWARADGTAGARSFGLGRRPRSCQRSCTRRSAAARWISTRPTTLELLKANAVVVLTGVFDDPSDAKLRGSASSARRHSTVDDSLVKGSAAGSTGWPNRDLDVGAIIALAPSLAPYEKALQKDEATIRSCGARVRPCRRRAQPGRPKRPPDGRPAAAAPRGVRPGRVNLHTHTGWARSPTERLRRRHPDARTRNLRSSARRRRDPVGSDGRRPLKPD
jgi:hypothetical protein